ncbi:MAG: DUF429 domain-containing protein [Limnobacter sp.]|nr:DUF429 domain-containing protein [Limnobacter sp.]
MNSTILYGIDFSSQPKPKKPIAVVQGLLQQAPPQAAAAQPPILRLEKRLGLPTLSAFDAFLKQPGPFLAAIDMPFGLSRQLVDGLGWPGAGRTDSQAWASLIAHYGALSKTDIRQCFKAWCDARPPGKKFAHRVTDSPAGASPSMKWVNPPVAFMLREGAPRLLQANLCIPGMHVGDADRVAVEAYPGYLARKIVARQSYKTDKPAGDTQDRQFARSEILCAMEEGMLMGIQVSMPRSLRADFLLDAKGDWLDAALCCLVAAWCETRRTRFFGLPSQLDPVEGWIAGVPGL